MVYLSTSDMFEVHNSSLIADYDKNTIVNLYQPIIGFSSVALYFTLINEVENQKINSVSTHEQILLKMKMSSSEFLNARKALEGVGLLKTFLTKEGGIKFYRYELFAPKTPNQFFDDVLLFGTLVQYIGKEEIKRIKLLYKNENIISEGENISASFGDVYHPDFNEPSYMEALNDNKKGIKGRKRAKIDTEFSYELFFNELNKDTSLNETYLNKYDMKEIERIATLYGVKESLIADVVKEIIDINKNKGERIDFVELDNRIQNMCKEEIYINSSTKKENKPHFVNSDTDLGKKINIIESTSPKKYLSLLQNGTMVASSDLRIIDSLSKNFKLSNAVINVIVDYVLTNNNNMLSRAYAEKIAASMSRENIDSAVDAMNYLIKSKKSKGKKTYKSSANKSAKKGERSKVNGSSNMTQEDIDDWNRILDELGANDEDGKA